jgi:multimeric flavodoxin WrbA
MKNQIKVTAVIGTYRKGGIIDTAVDVMLSAASEEGAEIRKIYLVDTRIEFCTNCRSCMQEDGTRRGRCPIADEMGDVLDELERSDAIILASPVNFGTVTAVMKRFIERLACYAYWPWGMNAPQMRVKRKEKPSVVVVSSAAPAFIARIATCAVGLLKKAAGVVGGRTIGVIFVGLAAQRPKQALGGSATRKARRLGRKLVAAARTA